MSEFISGQEPEFEIKENSEDEKLLHSVMQEYVQRRDDKQEPYFSTNMIETISLIPKIESKIINFEDLKNEVSTPGTMTHTIDRRAAEHHSVSPAIFWSEYGLGKKSPFIHVRPGESAISFNITCPNGSNPSIESEKDFSLKNADSSSFNQDGLVIFSKSALEKMACYEFYNGENFQPLDEDKIGENFSEIIDFGLEEYGMAKGEEFFQRLKESFGIEFQPYSEEMYSINEQNQADLIIYAHLCLKYQKNPSELTEILNSKDFWFGKYNIENIVKHMKHMSNFGYRFRGIAQEKDQLIYKDINPEPEDIGSIVLLNSESEQNFVALNYKDHPSLQTEL